VTNPSYKRTSRTLPRSRQIISILDNFAGRAIKDLFAARLREVGETWQYQCRAAFSASRRGRSTAQHYVSFESLSALTLAAGSLVFGSIRIVQARPTLARRAWDLEWKCRDIFVIWIMEKTGTLI
jgi:hypothetical protein